MRWRSPEKPVWFCILMTFYAPLNILAEHYRNPGLDAFTNWPGGCSQCPIAELLPGERLQSGHLGCKMVSQLTSYGLIEERTWNGLGKGSCENLLGMPGQAGRKALKSGSTNDFADAFSEVAFAPFI